MSMQLVLLCVLSVYFSSINGSFISKAWANAQKMTVFEQEVEDVNAVHKIDNHLARRLIVMPLTEEFNPNQASEMRDKIEYGDKCSLPASLGTLIFGKPYEVPWIFEMKPVGRVMTLGESIAQENTMIKKNMEHSDSESFSDE